MKKIGHWLVDYIYMLRGQSHSYLYRNPPAHYLGHVVELKSPIILIPGLFSKWGMLSGIANNISLRGHPVYVVTALGRTTLDIPSSAKIVSDLIEQKNLRGLIIIAHSKGGLIGKYLLTYFNKEKRIKKLICISTPFAGILPAKYLKVRHFKELSTTSKIIQELNSHSEVNKIIVSVYPIFDNLLWPQSTMYLKGGTNIKVNVHGHHKILFSKEVQDKILEIIK